MDLNEEVADVNVKVEASADLNARVEASVCSEVVDSHQAPTRSTPRKLSLTDPVVRHTDTPVVGTPHLYPSSHYPGTVVDE
jgi:hypothetical protein